MLDFASTWGPAAADLTNKPLPLESYSAQKQLSAVQERPRPSPLESYLMQKQKVVESLTTRYKEAGKAKKAYELEHSFVIDEKKYTKQCCAFCHERGHNRPKCPNKNRPCKSAKYCGEIARHPDERDKLRELKAIRENWVKNWKKKRKEYEFRQGLMEKTMEDKIRDKLLLDVTERYTSYSDSGSSINHL